MNINIQNLSKSFGGRDILSGFSLEVQGGVRLCVCGPNGSGKSTLLRIIAGLEAPDSGKILISKEARLGFVEQELDESRLDTGLLSFVLDVLPDWNDFWQEWETAVQADDESSLQRLSVRQHELELRYGYNPEHRAKAVLSGLGFAEHKWHLTLRQLSGGWRERAKLARVLTAGSDALLLDEPTNHLDLEAVEWLESFLLDYQGVLVFVAHDRVFMDKVGTHILYMPGNGKAMFRKGSFSAFIDMQEEMQEQRARESARLQGEIDRKMDFVRRFKAKATKARQAASRQKMAKRLEKELDGLRGETKRRELDFRWPVPQPSERTVLSVSDLHFSFADGSRMWNTLSFSLYRGQKIALVGPNGCGKSTLLKLLTGKKERESGSIVMGQQVRLGYFAQHRLETLDQSCTVLGEIRRLADPRSSEEELMSVLGLFLLGQNYFERPVSGLSGGEKTRLALASLFLARCNFLILDEPTNHLDLESREALIEALESFKGTVLLVAHDRRLLSEVADQIWALGPEGFTVFERGFEEYAQFRKKTLQSENEKELGRKRAETGRTYGISRDEGRRIKREQAEERKNLARLLKPLQDCYAGLEAELELVLARQAENEALLADQAVYNDSARASELLKSYHQLQSRAESLLEQLVEAEKSLAAHDSNSR